MTVVMWLTMVAQLLVPLSAVMAQQLELKSVMMEVMLPTMAVHLHVLLNVVMGQ